MAAAKSYWGYEPEVVRAWAARADFSPEALRAVELYVGEMDGRPLAWSALTLHGDICTLDDIWVEPPWIGRGIGTQLFRHAVARAQALGASTMEWRAEPKAVGFYEKLGGRYLRDSEPTSWGRPLPVMGLEL